jgi:CTP:molybdopterin cytidylyltransferase MocA
MKVNLGKHFEVEYRGNKKIFRKDGKIFYEYTIPFIRETCSFIILFSRNFDIEKIKGIVNSIEKLRMDFDTDIIFVVGSNSDELALSGVFKEKFYKCVVSEKVDAPIFSSFKSGLRHVSSNSIGAVLILGSRALPEEETLRKIVGTLKTGASIVVPVKDGKRTHPVAFNRNFFDKLLSIRKEKGIPYILKNYENLIEFVEI